MNKKLFVKLLFPLVCLIIVVIIVFLNNDVKDVFDSLKAARAKYIWISVALLLAYFILWPISLYVLVRSRKLNIKFSDVFLIGSIEHFFNGITPFATGGQPFEAVFFKRKGVKFSDSTGILLINYISFQTIITVASIISFIFNYSFLKENVPGVLSLVIIGVVINTFVLFVFVSLGCSKTIRKIFLKIMILLSKIKFLKKLLESKIESFDYFCRDYQEAFREIMKNKTSFFLVLVIKLITMLIYYAIPFYILRALGVKVLYSNLFFIIGMTCFSICMTCWFPTPGSSGGIEFAFKTLFVSIAGVTTIKAVSGMLLWRFFTYYLVMFLSFICYILLEYLCKTKKEEDSNEIDA